MFALEIYLFLKILFIYFYREGKGGRKRVRETSMYERNMDQLPLASAPLRGLGPQPRHMP